MAKKIAQCLLGITIVLVVLIVYFIQVNNNAMVMFSAKLMISCFISLWLLAALAKMMEKETLNKFAKVGIIAADAVLLIYCSFMSISQLVDYSIRLDEKAGVDGAGVYSFYGWIFLIILTFGALFLLSRRHGGQHD